MYSFIFTYIMRMDTMCSMNFSEGVDVSVFAEYIDYVAVQSTAHVFAQIYAVCCFGAIAGIIGYMALCVPSPEEVEARRRSKEILDYNMGFVDELGEMKERELTDEELIGLSLGVVEDETPFGESRHDLQQRLGVLLVLHRPQKCPVYDAGHGCATIRN